MIRKPEEFRIEYKEHMRDGDGTVQLTHFITGPEELNGKGRLFAKITLNPGCSIGYHVHEGDAELFYILKGTAEYNDAGEIRTVTAGDVTICPAGTGHGIANKTDEVRVSRGDCIRVIFRNSPVNRDLWSRASCRRLILQHIPRRLTSQESCVED